MRSWLRAVACAALLIAGDLPASAQQSIDLASISGSVTDASGGVVAGAQVTARHKPTNVATTAVSDDRGRFRLASLRIGPYEVTVRGAGFRDAVRNVTLTAGSAFDLPIAMELASIGATIIVSSHATDLEAARSQIATTVSIPEIEALPMNGRSFLDLAFLVPGVSPANVGSTQLFPETSAVPGATLSVGSQRNLSNNFIVDGLSANDDAAALSGITYGVDAIEQFQVVTSGAQAELGRALGGYVNVVTRSGTNERRGTAYSFFRDDSLNSRNPLLNRTLPMDQVLYGASHGGPIVANRAFYFVNAERRELDQTGLVTILDASVAAINPRLDASGYPGPRLATGIYPNPVQTTNALARVDHQVSGRDQLSARFSFYDVSADNARGAGGLNASSASTFVDSTDYSVALSNMLTLGSRTLVESRAQFAHSDLDAPATDPVGPSVAISGIATFGASATSPTRRLNRLYQFVNNVSHQAGAHAIRGGVDVVYNDDTITFPRAVRGSYGFSSLANFLAGVYNNAGFTQTFGVTVVSQTNPNVGVFLQDEWKVHSSVTLNLGVRYDRQFLDTLEADANNVSPRLGAVWSPNRSLRTVVRGGAGLFYDRLPLRPLANALLSAGNTTDAAVVRQVAVTLSPTQAGAPVFPAILPSVVPSGTLVNFTTMDRSVDNAYSRQANVEVERHIWTGASATVGYHYLRGTGLLAAINRNAPTCVASGGNNGCRPNAAYANNSQYSSVGSSTYHGLHLSLIQRYANRGQFRVSYTLSKSMNNVGEFFFSAPIDPLDISKDWGRSDDDMRHRLVVNGAVEAPWGLQVSGMLQTYSALPMNILSGVTTVQGTPGRPIVNGEFIERNAGTGNDFLSLNARLRWTARVRGRVHSELMVEGFNLTNRTNVTGRNGTFGSGGYPTNPAPTFNQVTSVAESRAFQLGARLRF